MINTLQN